MSDYDQLLVPIIPVERRISSKGQHRKTTEKYSKGIHAGWLWVQQYTGFYKQPLGPQAQQGNVLVDTRKTLSLST